MNKDYYILSLDGGGSKGIYTLGVLKELEKMLGTPLCERFDLIYGTSTGSIITALLALGESADEIEKKYLKLIPKIMDGWGSEGKSLHLQQELHNIFSDRKFQDFKTNVGIIAMNYDDQKPLIFKNSKDQAHGMGTSFEPGFGCLISDAIQASCAAYPIFKTKTITTKNQGRITAVDGGFIANNPALFSLIDSYKSLNIPEENIKLLSIGVGRYIEKPIGIKHRVFQRFKISQLVERVLAANSATNETLTNLLFPNLSYIRINEAFPEPQYGTNMVETNIQKLEKLSQLGRNSYSKNEKQILELFKKNTKWSNTKTKEGIPG